MEGTKRRCSRSQQVEHSHVHAAKSKSSGNILGAGPDCCTKCKDRARPLTGADGTFSCACFRVPCTLWLCVYVLPACCAFRCALGRSPATSITLVNKRGGTLGGGLCHEEGACAPLEELHPPPLGQSATPAPPNTSAPGPVCRHLTKSNYDQTSSLSSDTAQGGMSKSSLYQTQGR